MRSATQEVIDFQRAALAARLERLLEKVGRRCAPVWHSQTRVDAVLKVWLARLPECRVLYALDVGGVQISSNVYADAIQSELAGQDLSRRPYFAAGGGAHFSLSDVYISRLTRKTCVTALYPVTRAGRRLGSIAADFDLGDVPAARAPFHHHEQWERIRGDPRLRSGDQRGAPPHTLLDERLDDVLAIVAELVCERGIFHAKLHFSSGQTTLWLMDDPYRYRLHLPHEIIDPSICMIYRRREYPASAVVQPNDVHAVLDQVKALRCRDASIQLRSASVNIMNATVGLSFSNDDTSYLPVDAFAQADPQRWLAAPAGDRARVCLRAGR